MRKAIFAALALTSLMSGESVAATTWATVANEYQQFSLSGTKTVRYGAGSSWVEKSLSGTQACSNQTFGRDPAVGLAKICQVGTTSTTTSTTPTTTTTTTTWSTVASEYATFSLSSTKTVRYGTGTSWIQKSLSGTQYCSNQTFGSDPARGLAKMCQVATTTTTATTTPTTSTSGATSGTSSGSTSTTGTWSTVANEYGSFSLSSTKNVRYGAGTSWVEKSLTGTQACGNETFGRDPAVGLAKVCQVLASSTTASSGTTSGSTSGSTTGSTGGTGSTGSTTTPVKAYSASLSWTIPTMRTDGKPLSVGELKGYEVYYTNDSGTLTTSVAISGSTTVNTVVSNLPSGKYHFSISAVDTAGLKSVLSTVASVTFP